MCFFNPFMFNNFSFMPFMMSNFGFNLGMGLGNMFTGSIFGSPSYMNYGYSNFSYYPQAQAQAQVQPQQFLSKEQSLRKQHSDCETQIKAELQKLGESTEADYNNYQVETKYTDALIKAQNDKTNAQGECSSLRAEVERLLAIKDDDRTGADDFNYQEKRAQYEKLKTELAENGKYDQAIKQAEEAKAAREKEIKEAKDKLAELIPQRTRLEGQINYVRIDNADGTALTQSTAKQFNKKYVIGQGFQVKNEKKNRKYDASDIDRGDLQYLLAQYRTSTDQKERIKYRDTFKKLYEDNNIKLYLRDEFKTMYDLICQ